MTLSYREYEHTIHNALKSMASEFNLLNKAPNGQRTNFKLTMDLHSLIQKGVFDGGKWTGDSYNDLSHAAQEQISTTQKNLGRNLFHLTVSSPLPMPNALRICVNISRGRGELQDALLSTNDNNETVRESIERYLKAFDDNASEIEKHPILQEHKEKMEQCLKIIESAENQLAIAHKWNKEKSPARFLA